MDYLYAVFLGLLCPDPGRLGHPDWQTREATQLAFRLRGPLSWAELHRARAGHESPEVRNRAHRLLSPLDNYLLDLKAAAVLLDPWPLADPMAFWRDEQLRHRAKRIVEAHKVAEWWANGLTPSEHQTWFAWTCPTWISVAAALAHCKYAMGVRLGWPFE